MTKKTEFIHIKDNEAVGYCRPPKHSRFKKGQSGNPKGRPRAVDYTGWENPLQKYLLEPMTVTVKNKKKKVPVVDLLIMNAIRRALEGCTKHLKLLIDGSGGLKALIQEQERQMNEADRAVIKAVYEAAKHW
jgi:hypothetical protein